MVEQVIGRPDIRVVSNPEFLREGSAVRDSLHPDRLVVGADDAQAAALVGGLFASTGAPLIVTDATTSETIKYASNAFLATKLSYVNAVAGLCEEVGADVRDVMLGLGYDKRIGFEFLRPGPGWGGSCLPKDTRALLHIGRGRRATTSPSWPGPSPATSSSWPGWWPRSRRPAAGRSKGVTVAVWGLTFKANTDDRRDSPEPADRPPPGGPRGHGAGLRPHGGRGLRRPSADERPRRPAPACRCAPIPTRRPPGRRWWWC